MENKLLNREAIRENVECLCLRIEDRFPETGLHEVCRLLLGTVDEAQAKIAWIGRPRWSIRGLVAVIVVLIVTGLIAAISNLEIDYGSFGFPEFVQLTEAGINDIVIIGAAVIFLISIEGRSKRSRVIRAVNELRSIAQVIDMYQLTKDPGGVLLKDQPTEHSPRRTLSPFELERYLDYCSEMLALTSKISFLYVQEFDDPACVRAVNELENLTTGLSRKIWQKIMILLTESGRSVEEDRD